MTLAAVLLDPAFSVPAAAALTLWLLWYWRQLGRPLVPESRRRIRRAATAVMLAGLPCLVVAMSVLDAETRPGAWALAWVLVMFLLALVLAAATIDVFNTLRLSRQERLDRLVRDAIERAQQGRGPAG